jgi:hypothetical protein
MNFMKGKGRHAERLLEQEIAEASNCVTYMLKAAQRPDLGFASGVFIASAANAAAECWSYARMLYDVGPLPEALS